MTAYYNEFDPFAAAWLKQLIDRNLIAKGDVDVRSITEVQPNDLKSYTQCHFFAGIGGWSHALRLAGWDDSRPVWTGSCPCQSFSLAGEQKGKDDARHLWPVWFRLISECCPTAIFGEQVAPAIAHEWLDETATDLESQNYAIGSAVLPACSVGSPHKRERLFFVANSNDEGRQGWLCGRTDTQRQGEQRHVGCDSSTHGIGQWDDVVWLTGQDGKSRPAQSGLPLLVDGVPNRVASLRGYGNAIVPQVAAEFIKASM